ncbi:MAG TPA: hypothetical protein VLN59_17225 [Burkholderiales bacterium]|nr:hypothetical protein [Burkholderiales bacterium]
MESEMGPMESPRGSEELTDVIASIEMERQERAREVGNAAACVAALHKLQALHVSEKEALQLNGPSAEHSANLAALAVEIGRVQKMGGGSNRLSLPDAPRREQGKGARRGAPRAPIRNHGRRTMGRSGGR